MTKVTVERAALLPVLSKIAAVVQARNTVPILSNLLLQFERGRLRLTGSDLDIWYTAEVDAQGAEAMAITLPADMLLSAVKQGDEGGQIEFSPTLDGGRMGVALGRARYRMASLPAVDFPAARNPGEACAFEIGGKALGQAIAMTTHSISTEETRYYLNGIYMHRRDEELRFCSTDGHRLALHGMPRPIGVTDLPGMIVPRAAVRHIAALCEAAGDGALAIAADASMLSVSLGTTRLVTKLIDGSFPEYERVIPRQARARIEVDSARLRAAVERVSIAATEKTKAVALNAKDGILNLKVKGADGNEADHDIDCTMISSDPWSTGFNGAYLTSLMAATGPDTITIHQDDMLAPAMITAKGDDQTTNVLMPLRI